MKQITLILTFLSFSIWISATPQQADLLIFGSDTIYLKTFPLESIKLTERPFGKTQFYSTACSRGYRAIWRIIDNKLYLEKIIHCYSDGNREPLNIIELFENNKIEYQEKEGMIFAGWFSQKLVCFGDTRRSLYSDKLFLSAYFDLDSTSKISPELQLVFKNGVLIQNNIKPFNSYNIGDTLTTNIIYYWRSDLKDGNPTIKSVIKRKKGKMVDIRIISYGSDKRRKIKKIKKDLRYNRKDYWVNPRYWKQL